MSNQTTRREVLKQLSLGAGATLLTPILDQIAAHASGDEKSAVRKRVVFVVQANGIEAGRLVPSGVVWKNESPTNTLIDSSLKGKELSKSFEPLTPFKDRLAIVLGLSCKTARSDHSTNHGALAAAFPWNIVGPTIDHAIAKALPSPCNQVAIGYGDRMSMNYSLSAAGPNMAHPVICTPEMAFKSLFGSVADGEGKKMFDLQANVLDFMVEDVKRARAALVGEERQKLDAYLGAYESMHTRQAQIAAMREELKKVVPQLGDKMHTSVSSLILEAQFESGAAALISGLTNVLLLTSGGGGQRFGQFPEFGIPDLHGIGHGGTPQGKSSNSDCFVELHQFHTKLVAGLAKKLESIPEGNGTMLDNTLIVFLSDSAEGHHPQCKNWPMVLLGNLGGKLKTNGRYLEFPGYLNKGHRTLGNLYSTLLHAVGKPVNQFGVLDPGLKDVYQAGPITELLA